MSDKDLTVTITGRDGVSKTFVAISDSAKAMGNTIEKAGKSAQDSLGKADKGVVSFGKSLNTFQQEMESSAANLQQLGKAFDFLTDAGLENQRLTSGLAKAYGDASYDMIEFSEHVQDTTKFSNDAAQASILLANSLSNNYGLAADDIQALTERAADMAQMFGLELPDAMTRLAAAIRGEGEAAEALGLNMSDAAVAAQALEAGIVGWSVPGALSESEKAAFRFQLLMEQSAFATGTAADAARGASGTIAQLGNEFQDVATSASQMLGPLPAIGGALADAGSQAFYLAGGGAAVADTFKSMSGAIGKIGPARAILSGLTSPLTAIGLAAGVATVALVGMYGRVQDAAEASKSLDEVLNNLRMEGLEDTADQLDEVRDKINGVIDSLGEGNFDWLPFGTGGIEVPTNLKADISAMLESAFTDARVDTTAFVDWINSEIARIGDNPDLQIEFLNRLDDPSLLSGFTLSVNSSTATVVQAAGTMAAAFDDVEAAASSMGASFQELRFDGFDDAARAVGQLDEVFDKAVRGQAAWIDESGRVHEATQLSVSGLETMTFAFSKLEEQMASGNYDTDAILADMYEIANNPEYSPDQRSLEYLNLGIEVETTDKYLKELTATMGLGAAAMGVMGVAVGALADEQVRLQEAQQNLNDAALAYVGNGDNILAFLTEYLGMAKTAGYETLNLANNLDQTADALDVVLGYFNTIDSLGQRSSASGAIADYLFGPDGDPADGIGPLRDLLDSGVLGEGQQALDLFNRTIASGVEIQASNLRVQQDLDLIRVKQLPLLEQEQLAYEGTIDALSRKNPEEQRHALYLMDSANASKLASVYNTAYAASLGEIPAEVASEVILNAAQADPVLYQLLEDYGLIEEGANGEIKVNFPEGESLTATIGDLTGQLYQLVDVLDDGHLNGSPIKLEVEDNATPKLKAYETTVNDLTGDAGLAPVVLTIEAKDNAAPIIDDYQGGTVVLPPATVDIEVGADFATPTLGELESAEPVITTTFDGDDTVIKGKVADLEDTEVVVPVSFKTAIEDKIGDVKDFIGGLFGGDDSSDTVTITTELVDNASEGLNAVGQLVTDLDGDSATLVALGDIRDAMGEFADVERRHRGLDGDSSTMYVEADTSDAAAGISWAQGFDGSTIANAYVHIWEVYHAADGGGGGGSNQRHGGIPEFAHGGMVPFWGGEAGPEIAYFADGSHAVLPFEGMYVAPPATYISPANASASSLADRSGVTINVNVQNAYGIEDLAGQLTPILSNVLVEVIEEQKRGLGVL